MERKTTDLFTQTASRKTPVGVAPHVNHRVKYPPLPGLPISTQKIPLPLLVKEQKKRSRAMPATAHAGNTRRSLLLARGCNYILRGTRVHKLDAQHTATGLKNDRTTERTVTTSNRRRSTSSSGGGEAIDATQCYRFCTYAHTPHTSTKMESKLRVVFGRVERGRKKRSVMKLVIYALLAIFRRGCGSAARQGASLPSFFSGESGGGGGDP